MKVFSIIPRGYCSGVVQAIQTVKKTAAENQGQPLYLLGMLVHNQWVIQAIEARGVKIIERSHLDEALRSLPKGKIILSAHGTSDQVKAKITAHGFEIVDTICHDVISNMDLIRNSLNLGQEVIFIGKKGHPEAEATVAINPSRIHLVDSIVDIDDLPDFKSPLFLTNQTTLSMLDVYLIQKKIREKYPSISVSLDLCKATITRQEAVLQLPEEMDAVVVVGDQKSNNSNMLTKIALSKGKKAFLIGSLQDLDINELKTCQHVAVTAGASTPAYLTNQVIHYLQQLDWNQPTTLQKPAIDISKIL